MNILNIKKVLRLDKEKIKINNLRFKKFKIKSKYSKITKKKKN